MAENLGKAVLELDADQSKLDSAIDRAGAGAQTKGQKIEAAFSKAAKVGAVALAAIGGATVYSVKAASDLEEQVNKTSVVFGKAAGPIQEWGRTTADSIGISNRAALEAAGTFGNMLVPMGFARGKAAEMSRSMVALAADMASFNNASPEDVLEALRSGLAGETEPLRKFGVFLNDARLKQEAMNLGLYNGKGPLDAQAKAAATYAVILKDTKDAQGDFARTADSVANQQRLLKAQVEDAAAAFGEAFLPAARSVMGVLLKFLGVLARHKTATKVLVGIVAALAAATIAASAAFKVYRAATKAAAVVQWLLNAAMRANPLMMVITALTALAAGLVIAYKKSETFRRIVDGAFSIVKKVVKALVDTFDGVVSWVKRHWKTIAILLAAPFAPLVILATDAFGIRSKLIGAFTATKKWVKSHWPEIATILSGPFFPLVALATDAFGIRSKLIAAFQAVLTGAKTILNNVVSAITGFFIDAYNKARELGGKILGGLTDGITGIVERVGDFLGNIPGKIAEFFTAIYGRAAEIGTGIKNGVIDGITGVVARVGDFLGNIPGKIASFFDGVFERAKTLGGKIKDGVIDGITGVVARVGDFLGNIPGKIASFASEVFERAKILGESIKNGIKDGLAGLGGFILNKIRSAWNHFVNWWNKLHVTIDFPDWLPKIPDEVTIEFPDIGHLASGGAALAGTPYLVGELGPELFVPSVSGHVAPNSALGGSLGTTVHVHVAGSVITERDLVQAVRRGLQKTGLRIGAANLLST